MRVREHGHGMEAVGIRATHILLSFELYAGLDLACSSTVNLLRRRKTQPFRSGRGVVVVVVFCETKIIT